MSAYLRWLLVLGTLCTVQATYNGIGWWLRQPYDKDTDFNFKAEYTKDYYVNCTGDFDVEFWVIPDMRIIDGVKNSIATYPSISKEGESRTEWYGDGKALSIKSLEEDQFGFYFCHGTDANGNRQVVKRAINYKGPYFADLWAVYRKNTIVAVTSSLAFLIVMTVSCLVYEWKFSDDFGKGRGKGTAAIPFDSTFDGNSTTGVIPNDANAMNAQEPKDNLPDSTVV